MTLGEALRPHLPFLRRYARALTGSQASGDRQVRLTLEYIISAPGHFPADVDPKLGLYKIFQDIGLRGHHSVQDNIAPGFGAEGVVQARLKQIPSRSRQILLLSAMEGFGASDIAYLLDVDEDLVIEGVEEALAEIDRQTHARVLIIEDHPFIRRDVEEIVLDLGHDVVGKATTAKEAIAMATTERPNLILADIHLADNSNGVDAVVEILHHIRATVIFITAYPDELLTGERLEPAFLITKPFQSNTVKATIAQALFLTV